MNDASFPVSEENNVKKPFSLFYQLWKQQRPSEFSAASRNHTLNDRH